MRINFGHGYFAVWNGRHTINYYDDEGKNYDCATFGFEKDYPTQLEALSVILQKDSESR